MQQQARLTAVEIKPMTKKHKRQKQTGADPKFAEQFGELLREIFLWVPTPDIAPSDFDERFAAIVVPLVAADLAAYNESEFISGAEFAADLTAAYERAKLIALREIFGADFASRHGGSKPQ
jgi:hypothetical protein